MTRLATILPACAALVFITSYAVGERPLVRGLTVAPAPLSTLVHEAEVIIHGHVVDRRYEEAIGHPGLVQTRLTIWAWDVVKPAPVPLAGIFTDDDGQVWVEIVLPGGVMNGVVTVVPGVPKFRVGEEVVTLLTSTPLGLTPIGYGLGSWRVSTAGTIIPISRIDRSKDSAAARLGAPLRAFTDHLRALSVPSRAAP